MHFPSALLEYFQLIVQHFSLSLLRHPVVLTLMGDLLLRSSGVVLLLIDSRSSLCPPTINIWAQSSGGRNIRN